MVPNIYMENYVLKNFLTTGQKNDIEYMVTNPSFPWFFDNGTISDYNTALERKCIIDKGINPIQFSHTILNEGKYNSIIMPIINTIYREAGKPLKIFKTKFNFLPKSTNSTFHVPHIDGLDAFYSNCRSAVYYVNDSDGDTYFFDNNGDIMYTIEPEKGKLVIFNGKHYHSSSSPTINDFRIVFNIFYEIVD